MLSTLAAVARELNASVSACGDHQVTGIAIDTRTLNRGDLFFALQGNRDGHQFLEQAQNMGACGAVVSSRRYDLSLPQIVVGDTLAALQLLASKLRRQLGVPVVAVTGSNGKTTTKDITAAVLGTKYRTLKTRGNLNNEIGVPLTLLRLNSNHQAAVVEMAMRGLGQIKQLADIAKPDIGVITNVSATHLELLGSIENIARAKGELLAGLPENGVAVLNGDDSYCRAMGAAFPGKTIYFGLDKGNDFRAEKIDRRGWHTTFTVPAIGSTVFCLPLPGSHNLKNALAALAVGRELGIPEHLLVQGLNNVALSEMRLQIVEGIHNSKIINDAYNANPASTIASLKILVDVARARTVAVLGDMYELGKYTEAGHREVGRAAVELSVDLLVTVGDTARIIAEEALRRGKHTSEVRHFDRHQEALDYLTQTISDGDTVLLKASRGMKLETIAAGLTDAEEKDG